MKRVLCFSGLTVLLIINLTCGPNRSSPSFSDDPPLRLSAGSPHRSTGADNSRCHVCHMNYLEEDIAVVHARAGFNCEHCHGPSDAHCSDEDNITPPDIMFARSRLVPACLTCHSAGDLQKNEARRPVFVDPPSKVCTDCHGEHRLVHRTRIWDKTTRRLLQDDQVRMMTDEMLK